MNAWSLTLSMGPTSRRLTSGKLIGYFALLDLLVLPYFQWIIVPYSLPLILVGCFVLRIRSNEASRYFAVFSVIAFGVIASAIISLFLQDNPEYQAENIKRAIQFTSSFCYFFYFYFLASQLDFDIRPIVLPFVLWYSALSLLFMINPSNAISLIHELYGRLVTAEDVIFSNLRFSYLFNDPNTGIYFFLVAISPFLLSMKPQDRKWWPTISRLVLVAAFFNMITAQSLGAIVALALMVVSATILPHAAGTERRSAKTYIVALVSGVCLVFASVYFVSQFRDNDVFEAFYTKLAGDSDYDSREYMESGGKRFEKWSDTVEGFAPYPLGRGWVLELSNEYWGAHSDLLQILYSYGFVTLIPVLWFFFSRIFYLTPLLIAALVPFLVNSLVAEQKLLALFLSLLGISIAGYNRRKALEVRMRDGLAK